MVDNPRESAMKSPATRKQPPHHVLVIDDDPDFCRLASWMVTKAGFSVATAHDHDQAIGRIEEQRPHVLLVDRHLEDEDGLNLIPALQARVPSAAIILVTARSSTDLAVEAMKAGAYDFLDKPIDEARLVTVLNNAVERTRLLDKLDGTSEDDAFEELAGTSSEMRTVFAAVKNVAPTAVNVMVRGESGTGKELIAQALHRRSQNPDGPFVAINMAAVPSELVESTLFGHEKGSFTGADARKIGACEEAHGGTLFLDEITEMSIELQAKLLRFLQERTFRRVGGSAEITSDARIVSATNRDPRAAVADGRLREDLYYRLNVVPIDLPPLRDRRGDIGVLAQRFVTEFSKTYGKSFAGLDRDAKALLRSAEWPGNVRQLRSTIERAIVMHNGSVLTAAMIALDDADSAPHHAATGLSIPSPNFEVIPQPDTAVLTTSSSEIIPLDQLERQAIENALHICNGSAAEAARRLNISTATIYRRIKQYRISTDRPSVSDSPPPALGEATPSAA